MAQDIQRILIKYEADIKELRKDLDGAKKELREVESTATKGGSKITSVFKGVATGIAAAFTVQQVIAFGKELNSLQREAQGVKRAFDAAFDQGALLRLREATAGTVSDLELMKVALRAREFNIPATTLAKGLEFARIQANKLGQDVGFLTNSIVDGLGRKSPLILDNLGISQAELSEAVKETGDFYEGVAAVIEKKLGEDGASGTVLTLADRQAALNARVQNLAVQLSNTLLPVFESLTNAAGNFLDVLEQTREFGLVVGSEIEENARKEAEATLGVQLEALKAQVDAGQLTAEQAKAIVEQTLEGTQATFDNVRDNLDTTGEKARRLLNFVPSGTGLALALGSAGLGQGAREGAEELVKLQGEIDVLSLALGDFGTAATGSPDGGGDGGAKKATEDYTDAVLQAIEANGAFKRSIDELVDGFLFDLSPKIDKTRLEILGLRDSIFDEGGEDAEDLRVLGVTPETFNNALAEYENFAASIGEVTASLSLDAAQSIAGTFATILESVGASAGAVRAFVIFQKFLAIAEIAINLQKELSAIAANPAWTALPDGGAIVKGIATAAAIGRAGVGTATVLATVIPEFQFAEGTSDAPGGMALVGEQGPEIMHVPKGARVFTANASKREKSLIDAINEGRSGEFITQTYVNPALSNFVGGVAGLGWGVGQFDSSELFYIRQAIKSNKTVELGPKTRRALTSAPNARYH